MADRTDLLDAALQAMPEGIALVDDLCRIVFWNHMAETVTGYASRDLLGRTAPDALRSLLSGPCAGDARAVPDQQAGHGTLIHVGHKLGHDIPLIARTVLLRDTLGERIGMAMRFHPAESSAVLPHGQFGDGSPVEADQGQFEDHLETAFREYREGGECFGVLWILVDQARELRRTHGAGACESMISAVERALAQGLRPAEEMGRWGDDEFLVLSHERTPELLSAHAQVLDELARTADFRWWGDKVPLTVSIGAAQADKQIGLVDLMEKAKAAVASSSVQGGNRITLAPGRQACSPS